MAVFSFDANAAVSLGLAIVLGVVVGLVGFMMGRILPPRKEYPLKRERFEAGNPPKGRARGWFAMQYYPYLIVFLTVEPIVVYSFLFLMSIREMPLSASTLLTVILLSLIPPLVFGLDAARRVEQWVIARLRG